MPNTRHRKRKSKRKGGKSKRKGGMLSFKGNPSLRGNPSQRLNLFKTTNTTIRIPEFQENDCQKVFEFTSDIDDTKLLKILTLLKTNEELQKFTVDNKLTWADDAASIRKNIETLQNSNFFEILCQDKTFLSQLADVVQHTTTYLNKYYNNEAQSIAPSVAPTGILSLIPIRTTISPSPKPSGKKVRSQTTYVFNWLSPEGYFLMMFILFEIVVIVIACIGGFFINPVYFSYYIFAHEKLLRFILEIIFLIPLFRLYNGEYRLIEYIRTRDVNSLPVNDAPVINRRDVFDMEGNRVYVDGS